MDSLGFAGSCYFSYDANCNYFWNSKEFYRCAWQFYGPVVSICSKDQSFLTPIHVSGSATQLLSPGPKDRHRAPQAVLGLHDELEQSEHWPELHLPTTLHIEMESERCQQMTAAVPCMLEKGTYCVCTNIKPGSWP